MDRAADNAASRMRRRRALGVGLACAVVVVAALAVAWLSRPLPPAIDADPPTRMAIRDREGRLLRLAAHPSTGTCARPPLLTARTLPEHVVRATLAAEDRRFFWHLGADPIGLARAVRRNLRAGRTVAGGSTITQQLAGLLNPEPRTVAGKLAELDLALRLEAQRSKRALLAEYLNRTAYGNGCLGITAAADHYFARTPEQLSMAEAALLAGLVRAPTALDPRRAPAAARTRAHQVLRAMRAARWIKAAELERALADPLTLAARPAPRSAPHAVDWAIATLPPACGTARLSIDRVLNERLEGTLAESLAPHRMTPAPHGAIVVLDHTNGEVLAMVGAPDYEDPRGGQWNAALALRQPGSALKPFTYALAFAAGRTPADLVADVPTSFLDPSGDYVPRNYSSIFHGPVRVREALASSYNIPAVRVLEEVGGARLLDLLRGAGITSLGAAPADYGLGLTLGVGEVTLLELCRAYAIFPRHGRALGLRVVRAIADRRGEVLAVPAAPGSAGPQRAAVSEALIPETAAFWVTDILADPEARIGGFGAHGPLEMPFAVAAKTGTSSNFRDAWTVGFDRRYVVGVWVGNLDGEPLPRLSAARAAAPLFRAAFYAVRAWESGTETGGGDGDDDRSWDRDWYRDADRDGDRGGVLFPPPAALARRTICALSGGAPGPACRERLAEWLPADAGAEPCRLHALGRDGQVSVVMPREYGAWLERGSRPDHRLAEQDGPFAIRAPRDGARFFLAPDLPRSVQTIRFSAGGGRLGAGAGASAGAGPGAGTRGDIVWEVNGNEVGRGPEIRWALVPGRHRVSARHGAVGAQPITIEVRPAVGVDLVQGDEAGVAR
jgi:penicillin-binding protein 1C